jgi:hypothetical protein
MADIRVGRVSRGKFVSCGINSRITDSEYRQSSFGEICLEYTGRKPGIGECASGWAANL